MRPNFCPNCAAPLPEGSHGAQGFSHIELMEDAEGWDCFCDACYWSGDILPDFPDEASLALAKERHARTS